MQIDGMIPSALPNGALFALIGLVVTTGGTLIAQLITILRHSNANKTQIELLVQAASERRQDAKILLDQTRAESALLAEKTINAARMLSDKTERSAHDLRQDVRVQIAERETHTVKQTEELKALVLQNHDTSREITGYLQTHGDAELVKTDELRELVAQNTLITEDGVKAAKSAYEEANAVNLWRNEVNSDIKNLASSIQSMAQEKLSQKQTDDQKAILALGAQLSSIETGLGKVLAAMAVKDEQREPGPEIPALSAPATMR